MSLAASPVVSLMGRTKGYIEPKAPMAPTPIPRRARPDLWSTHSPRLTWGLVVNTGGVVERAAGTHHHHLRSVIAQILTVTPDSLCGCVMV